MNAWLYTSRNTIHPVLLKLPRSSQRLKPLLKKASYPGRWKKLKKNNHAKLDPKVLECPRWGGQRGQQKAGGDCLHSLMTTENKLLLFPIKIIYFSGHAIYTASSTLIPAGLFRQGVPEIFTSPAAHPHRGFSGK